MKGRESLRLDLDAQTEIGDVWEIKVIDMMWCGMTGLDKMNCGSVSALTCYADVLSLGYV
jgi:hypothetical protein